MLAALCCASLPDQSFGPILGQTPVAIVPGDTAETLAARVLIADLMRDPAGATAAAAWSLVVSGGVVTSGTTGAGRRDSRRGTPA